MKAIWGWSLAVIGATGICHAAESDPVAGIVSRAAGGWQDTTHARVIERGSDVLQNASIVRTEPPAADAEIEIYLLDGKVIKRSCAKGACANPIEIKESRQETQDLLKIIKDLLFSPEEQPVPAATMAATAGIDPGKSEGLTGSRKFAFAFAAGVVSDSGSITDVVLSREPSNARGSALITKMTDVFKENRSRSEWPVSEMFLVNSQTDAPSTATVCGASKDTLALCEGQRTAPGTYYGRGWNIYLFDSKAQVDCVSNAMQVGELLANWQVRTGDPQGAKQLGDKAKKYVDTQAAACRR